MSAPIERDDMLRVDARQALDTLTDLVNNVALGGIAYAKTSYARTRLQHIVALLEEPDRTAERHGRHLPWLPLRQRRETR